MMNLSDKLNEAPNPWDRDSVEKHMKQLIFVPNPPKARSREVIEERIKHTQELAVHYFNRYTEDKDGEEDIFLDIAFGYVEEAKILAWALGGEDYQ